MSSSSGSKETKDKKKKISVNKKVSQIEEGSGRRGGNDHTYERAKEAVKKTIEWMTQTQAKPGGLPGFFKSATFERSPPEDHKAYAFLANRHKNRNPDFPLYDHSRVRLKVEEESESNYINATNVSCPPCDRKWIVSQHPMEKYYEDFWRMVFYQEVDVIFAIFDPNEQLPVYFPTEQGKFFNHGQFFVHCWKMTPATEKYEPTHYTIEVLPAGCSNARYTTIHHYPHWPKGHVAPNPKVLMKGIRLMQPAESLKTSKCLVHSAEGINRAMSVVMVDYLVELMFRNNTVNITELITLLRSQRGGAFQNRVFCVYVLYVAIDYVKIRLTKYQSAPDVLLSINNLQAAMKKEFAGITSKESSASRKDGNNEPTIE